MTNTTEGTEMSPFEKQVAELLATDPRMTRAEAVDTIIRRERINKPAGW